MKKLPEDFPYLPEMFEDEYYPRFLVEKVKDAIKECADYIGQGDHPIEDIQGALDRMTIRINELEEEFDDNDSEIETIARDSIADTVARMLDFFGVDIDIEEAIRERNW
ncbi:MAG: DUF5713 family protein [Alistipes sp.]|nr:DUF5713 family protein [Alistipes sp.]